MGWLRPNFSYVDSAGPSAFFRCEKPISQEVADAAADASGNASVSRMSLFNAAVPVDRRPKWEAYLLDLARIIAFREVEGSEVAIRYARTITRPSDDELGYPAPSVASVAEHMRSPISDAINGS